MRWKKNSVLWTWTCSYVLIFLIPLTAIFINYGMNINTMKDEIVGANELTFDNATDNIDHYLELLRENYVYAFLNDSFEELKNRKNMDATFYSQTHLLQDQLYYYRNGVDDMFCMVYLKDKDYLVTGLNSCSAELYYSGMKHTYKDFIDYDAWREVLNESYKEDYFVAEGLNYWTADKCLVYANTVKGTRKEEYNILVSVPMSNIENVTDYLKENAWLLIHLDGQTPLVFHSGKLTEAPEWVENEEFYIRMQKASTVSGISYELVFSKQSIMDELRGVRANFWMNLVLTMLLAVGGMIILLRINYRPIRSIIDEIGEEEERSDKNEFERLKGTFARLTQEKQTTQQLVEKQTKELMNSRLLTLMKGRGDKLENTIQGEEWKVSLNKGIALVGFMLPIEQNEEDCDGLQFFILDNIFSELMEKEHFYHIEDGCFVYYLFDLNLDNKEEWRQEAIKKANYVCSMLYDKWGISVVGTVGEIGEHVDVIKHLYQNVMAAFEYGKVAGGHGVIDVRLLPDYDEFQLLEDYLELRFREVFAEKDIVGASTVVEQMFSMHDSMTMSMTVLKIRAYEAFSITMNIFREYVSDISLQEAAFSYLEQLIKAQTPEEMKACFNNLLQFQIGVVSRQQLKEGKGIVAKVMKYVQENYADCNLNLNSVAEGLGKNSRYISRTFKEETQMGILDYINGVRIEKAKELMASHKYTTQEVAEAVGYANIRTFRRAFEKVTGKMPGDRMR